MATDKLFFRSRHGGSWCGRIFFLNLKKNVVGVCQRDFSFFFVTRVGAVRKRMFAVFDGHQSECVPLLPRVLFIDRETGEAAMTVADIFVSQCVSL